MKRTTTLAIGAALVGWLIGAVIDQGQRVEIMFNPATDGPIAIMGPNRAAYSSGSQGGVCQTAVPSGNGGGMVAVLTSCSAPTSSWTYVTGGGGGGRSQ